MNQFKGLIITALQRNMQMRAEDILFIEKMQQLIGDSSVISPGSMELKRIRVFPA
jgi:hypothetical protein